MKLGFADYLTLIFITLKLTSYIDWSWWYVLAPSIVSMALGIVVKEALKSSPKFRQWLK